MPSPSQRSVPRATPASLSLRGGLALWQAFFMSPQAHGPPQAGWTREAQGWGSHGSSPTWGGVAGDASTVAAATAAVATAVVTVAYKSPPFSVAQHQYNTDIQYQTSYEGIIKFY